MAGVCDEMDPHKEEVRSSPLTKRILNGFEATTTTVDWKSYTCKRVVRSSFAGEARAYVGTLDMLEFTRVFCSLFLDSWKSLSDETTQESHRKVKVANGYHAKGILMGDEFSVINLDVS